MTTTTTASSVRSLRAGQVFSVPGTDLVPALIEAISGPVAGVRFIEVLDPADGEPIATRRVLGLDRGVLVHDVKVWHHPYTNTTDRRIAVRLGRREELVEPGGTLYYTGLQQPDLFSDATWELVESEHRPT